ncbi:immunity 26/phosphotriesterase HocA family protein [Shinella curvata]|uniref:Immunity 26/phosphotriesterase HocA family protein n=1 Tax=Shinella curvata TaxID=1817964 RepID=A0ABT8XL69_9HYPH|nr:immunity 26/phosphotriesterase HocA family protein [Shinella curvata]MCJ8056564.1 immunity 26/phosphotriesterase HocA family protein [Shinella curvata]MDO6124442.1 immunity 26/phosphotriesterase HocA family protein [Shinella curvata]
MASKRIRRRIGDILQIDLGDSQHCYAQVAGEPVIVFFDGIFTETISMEDIPRLPVAFRLAVSNYAVTRGVWPVIGSRPLTPENAEEPFFYKQDNRDRLFLYHSSFAAQNYERPASLADCIGLECAAVWDPEHVVDRLRDHALGQPNRWVEILKIKIPSISG